MKIFLIICLVSGLASSEKLDRSYLPPPGSKLSGGTLGDLDVPLEFPKQPTGPQLDNGKPELDLVINRRPAPTGKPDQKPGFNVFQNSYPVPKTTTSYAITQTTTFPADYEINQPNFYVNGSNVQPGVPGRKYQQPIRGPGQGPSYNQYQPGQSQSTATPYGTTARPPFPNNFNGLEYLPPATNQQSSIQGGSSYPSDLPQGPKYQNGQAVSLKQPGFTPGFNQQNQFVGNQNIPSTTTPQFQDERFGSTGPGSQQTQNQFPGNQFASSTTAPQYQFGQRYTTPGATFGIQDLPLSTAAPQYQDGQRLSTPGSNQQNIFSGNQDLPSSTTAPQFQTGPGFTTPGSNQQVFGARIPNQQNQYTGSQLPSSTLAPTPGSIQQSQYLGNQNYPSTAPHNYQDGQRFTTPGQIQGPGQLPFGSRVPSQNQYPGQTLPSSTVAPQFQDSERFIPGLQEGYESSVPTQQLQYPGNQNYPSSTTSPEYQTDQQFTTGPGRQNFPSTAAPNYQNGQRYTTLGDQGPLGLGQQFGPPGLQGHNQIVGSQNYPSSTAAPQFQGSRRYSTAGSQQRFETPQHNQYGNQNFPTSTTAPQYQDQRFSKPGQPLNQPTYPGSTSAPQYQQTLVPTPGTNQLGPSQQNQFQQPIYNQQIPSSTAMPQRFIPGSQPQLSNNNILIPGMEVAQQGLPGSQNYGNNQQQLALQPEGGSSIYGPAPSFSNQRFPSTTVGSMPARDFSSAPGFGTIGDGHRPERPQAEGDRNAEILNYENVLTPEGYYYSYDTSNGIHADETGVVGNGTRAQGGYTYTGDDGKVYSVVYTADENGFQPRGDHLPTPPPVPEAIQRVIDQANMDKEAGIDDDGSYNEEKYGYMKYEGPLTRLRPKNRPASLINGIDIPERNEDSIQGQNINISKPKGSRPGSKAGSVQEYESEETDTNDSDFEDVKGNRRISDKRPKPIKGLNAKDNRPSQKGTKTQRKPVDNSKNDGSGRLQISTEEYDDKVPNDDEEFENNDDLQDSNGYDVDSGLLNYRDDPNNRTDFHGLNKYLPESKKTNRKNLSGKKRPTIRVDGLNKPVTGGSKTTEGRYREESQDTKPDFVDESRTRVPSRKNQYGQKFNDQSKTNDQNVSLDSDDENNMSYDDQTKTNEEFDSNDATKPMNNNRKNKLTSPGSKMSGKPKRPTANKQKGVYINKENEPSTYEETGYEYTPPQRKFGSEEATKFPTRINQNGAQTTIRPFLTKNVHGDENEPADEYIDEYGSVKSSRPIAVQNYPGYNQGGESYNQDTKTNENEGFSTTRRPGSFGTSRRPSGRPQNTVSPQYEEQGLTGQEGESNQNNPEVNQNQGFSTTRRPTYGTSQRPFGRPQTTASPQYQNQGVTGLESGSYNQNNPEVIQDQGFSTTRRPTYGTSQRPSGRPQTTASPQYQDQGVTSLEGDSYNQNNPEVNQSQGFSTTRRPSYGTSQRPFGRPQTSAPQYQDQVTGQVYVSDQGPQRPGDKLFYNTNAPNRGTVGNVFSSTTPLPPSGPDSHQRPGQHQNIPDGSYYEATSPTGETYIRPGQVPSTTYRPNYSFGDKTSSVTVDGSGRPIQSTVAPTFDRTLKPTYSVRPGSSNQQIDRSRPNEGRFGETTGPETPGYQSTSAPIGEDFSGPKQPQRFDPETGYHYK